MVVLKNELPITPQDFSANPFHWEPFRQCWFKHLAGPLDVKAVCGDFVLHHKRMAKGLLLFREVKFYAGVHGWFHDFTPARLGDLLALSNQMDWDYCYMVWAESRAHLQAFDELRAQGFPIIHGFTKPMYLADLSNGYEQYWAGCSANYRSQMRRKIKKVQSLQPRLVRYERFDEIEPFFQEFFNHHITYWQQKVGYSFFSEPQEQAFNIAWAKQLHQAGKLWLQGLVFNDEVVNLSVSFVEDDILYWPLMINTGKYQEMLPGIISLHLRIQDAAQRGIRTFNMSYGDFDYKRQAATHTEARNVAVIINPYSLRGRLVGAWYAYKSKKGVRFN